MRTLTLRVAGLAVVSSLALAACSSDPEPEQATVADPAATAVVPGRDAGSLAAATASTLFEEASVVVVAGDDLDSQARAASLAVSLGVPVLVASDAADEELDRLDADTVLAVGDAGLSWAEQIGGLDVVPAPDDPSELASVTGHAEAYQVTPVAEADLVTEIAALTPGGSTLLTVRAPAARSPGSPSESPTEAGEPSPSPASEEPAAPGSTDVSASAEAALPATELPDPVTDVLVLASARAGTAPAAAAATSRAAGAEVTVMVGYDPRRDAGIITALEDTEPAAVLALGDGFGSQESFDYRLDVAATGAELPGGGKLVLPGRLMVALYGHPGVPALGVMGETDVEGAVDRAAELAAEYEPFSDVPVIPSFEIITTVAAREAGSDGNYSNESDIEVIRPWVEAADEAGMYAVLDLQPGRASFLEQAQLYEDLLLMPNVGLALDPEWHIGPDELPLTRIGSVTAEEVNDVVDYLADLVVENDIPQKLLVVHQFRIAMISDRDQLKTDVDQVAVLIHVDGFGTPSEKFETYDYLTADVEETFFWGWKNFIDEDQPTFTPERTMTTVKPTPDFVSYQ